MAAVGEGVGRDVEDAHDDGALAKRESAGAEAPVEAWARDERHEGILVSGLRSRERRMLDFADEEVL